MATQYFFEHGDSQHGPYSAHELQQLAAAGKINPTDAVWREGVGRPIPAARVGGLFPGAADDDTPGVAAAADVPTKAESGAAAAASPMVPASERAPAKPPVKERARRVVSIKGGTLVSQDGKHVQFRKKCEKCGSEEQAKTTAVIRPGAMKISYFCRRCRKGRTVEMVGLS